MATIKLDRDRTLKFSMRSRFKLGSINPRPQFEDLSSTDAMRAFHAICCFVWASETESAFSSPEQIADYLETNEQQVAAVTALIDTFTEAGMLKKKEKASPTT